MYTCIFICIFVYIYFFSKVCSPHNLFYAKTLICHVKALQCPDSLRKRKKMCVQYVLELASTHCNSLQLTATHCNFVL